MKTTIAVFAAASLSGPLFAQTFKVKGVSTHSNKDTRSTIDSISTEPAITRKYVDFSLNARLRYEFREFGDLDPSHAGTLRLRPGITLLPQNDVSFFVEGEFTEALVDDFRVTNADLTPFQANNTPILDPETSELNQAYVHYKKNKLQLKVGRQRIVLDNAAFVGDLLWRQNEQTYDAASLSIKGDEFSISYTYANRANRIFGSDASGLFEALEGDMHLLNGWKIFGETKVGAYAYLFDFDQASTNGFANRASSNTFGGYVEYKGLHAEFAVQTDGGESNLNREETYYAHLYYHTHLGNFHIKGGLEYLDADFYTPLSTVHAFNGFADRFIGSRLGVMPSAGINDFYLMVGTEIADLKLKGFAHYYTDDSMSQDLGWEIDFVAAKQIAEGAHLVSKLAYYNGGVSSNTDDDITQASIQIDYSF